MYVLFYYFIYVPMLYDLMYRFSQFYVCFLLFHLSIDYDITMVYNIHSPRFTIIEDA